MGEIKGNMRKILREIKTQFRNEFWNVPGENSGVIKQLEFILNLFRQRLIRARSPESVRNTSINSSLIHSKCKSQIRDTLTKCVKIQTIRKYSPRARSPNGPRLCYSYRKENQSFTTPKNSQNVQKFILPKPSINFTKSKQNTENLIIEKTEPMQNSGIRQIEPKENISIAKTEFPKTIQKTQQNTPHKSAEISSPSTKTLKVRNELDYILQDYEIAVDLVKRFVEVHHEKFPNTVDGIAHIAESGEDKRLLSILISAVFF